MSERDRRYLGDILERISRVEEDAAGGWEAFAASRRDQDAILRNLEVIGEAVKRLSDALRAARPDVRWQAWAGLRDVLIHQYGGVDLAEVWSTVEHDVPDLKRAVTELLARSDLP